MKRPTSWFYVAVLAGLILGAAVLFVFNPEQHAFYPQCQFHSLTGLECPGCGGLRAAHALLHGELLTALHLNALFVLLLPFGGGIAGRFLWARLRGESWSPSYFPALAIGLGVLVFAFGIVRNLPFDCFSCLRP